MRAMTQTLYTDIISNVTHTHTHTILTCYSVKITQSKAGAVALSQVRRVTWCDWLTLTFLSTIPGHWQQAPAAHSTHISVGQSWIRSLAMKTWTGDWTWTKQTLTDSGSHFMGITISIEEYCILYFLLGSHLDLTTHLQSVRARFWEETKITPDFIVEICPISWKL